MWIFLNNAFLSVVKDKTDRDMLMVRARLPGDIKRVFPEAKVSERGKFEADYRYRASIPRNRVADAIANSIKYIDYDNFKNSVKQDTRHNDYLRVWSVMVEAQERRRPKKKGDNQLPLYRGMKV